MIERSFKSDPNICVLARSYNVLHNTSILKEVIKGTFPSNNITNLNKKELHHLVNELLISKHRGELTLKAKLVDLFINDELTAAFEIRVNRSRADFATINGQSKSYEIKSELDNLSKLSKQIMDYEKVFDFNYIVIDEKHYKQAKYLVPKRYGIIVLKGDLLLEDRIGKLNFDHDSHIQLSLFNKKEFKQTFKIKEITPEKIIVNFSKSEINDYFKNMLKRRYAERWAFLVKNRSLINAIDYQFFFQHNIDPSHIYNS